MKVIEVEGTVEEGRCVRLENSLPSAWPDGGALDFLNGAEEDCYTLRDGKPFDDAR